MEQVKKCFAVIMYALKMKVFAVNSLKSMPQRWVEALLVYQRRNTQKKKSGVSTGNCDKGVGRAERRPGKCVSETGNLVPYAQKKRVI